jgi:hypothetical protein
MLTDDQPSIEDQARANRHLEPKDDEKPVRHITFDEQIGILLRCKNVPPDVIRNFERCLNVLRREGFILRKG